MNFLENQKLDAGVREEGAFLETISIGDLVERDTDCRNQAFGYGVSEIEMQEKGKLESFI